eukprot:6371367-Amphidinium_carterae.1
MEKHDVHMRRWLDIRGVVDLSIACSDGAHFGLIEQCPMACIEEAEAAERENLEEQEGEV